MELTQEQIEETKAHITENAEFVRLLVKREYGIETPYCKAGLECLERIVRAGRENYVENYKQLLTNIACYFGECLKKEFGGEWETVDGAWAVKIDNRYAYFPFTKVWKFYENGDEDSFVGMLETLQILRDKGKFPPARG